MVGACRWPKSFDLGQDKWMLSFSKRVQKSYDRTCLCLRPNKASPKRDPPNRVAVVPPSGTLAGTVVVDEKVNVARFNVWAERSQCPVVARKSRPGPVMNAVPMPDSSRPVSEA